MKPIHGEPADGTLAKLAPGEKEFLFRVVVFPAAALYHVGVYTGHTMEQARTLFMMGLYKSQVPVPANMELWINELGPKRIQTAEGR